MNSTRGRRPRIVTMGVGYVMAVAGIREERAEVAPALT